MSQLGKSIQNRFRDKMWDGFFWNKLEDSWITKFWYFPNDMKNIANKLSDRIIIRLRNRFKSRRIWV